MNLRYAAYDLETDDLSWFSVRHSIDNPSHETRGYWMGDDDVLEYGCPNCLVIVASSDDETALDPYYAMMCSVLS